MSGRYFRRVDMPRDCYHCPRTLADAFGPGAQLDIEPPPRRLPGTAIIPWIVGCAFAVLYGYIIYARYVTQ